MARRGLIIMLVGLILVGSSSTNVTVTSSALFSQNLILNCPLSLCLLGIDESSFGSSSLTKIRRICKSGGSECVVAVSKLIFSDVENIEDKELTVVGTCGQCNEMHGNVETVLDETEPNTTSPPTSPTLRVGLGVSNWGGLDRSTLCEDSSLIISSSPQNPVITCREFLSMNHGHHHLHRPPCSTFHLESSQ